jgi:hypothetical protein
MRLETRLGGHLVLALPHSVCVDRVRGARGIKCQDQSICLRHVGLGTHTKCGDEGWYALFDAETGRSCGQVDFAKTCQRDDPVQSYVLIRLADGRCFEAVELLSNPRGTIQLYSDAIQIGSLAEIETKSKSNMSWWQRILNYKRRWHAFRGGELACSLEVGPHVSNRSQLHLECIDGTSLPLRLGSEWFKPGTKLVIPPGAPPAGKDIGEDLYFVLCIVFRAFIFSLDFSN